MTSGVLVVRRPKCVRRIVVGFDGSPTFKRALAVVSRLAPPRNGQVPLVTGVELMNTRRSFGRPRRNRPTRSSWAPREEGIGHALFGSTTQQVVRGATCPVLTTRGTVSEISPV